MKNLINLLSSISQFFAEKRVVNRGGLETHENVPERSQSTDDEKLSQLQKKNVKRLRERFLNNPNRFREFAAYSQKVTLNLAKLGFKPPVVESKDSEGTIRRDATEQYKPILDDLANKIANAFNKNDRAAQFFFEAMIDLHIYTKFVDHKPKRVQVYKKVASKLRQLDRRTYAQLPNLNKNLAAQYRAAVASTRGKRKVAKK